MKVLDISQIPDKAFIDAIRVLNIVKLKLLGMGADHNKNAELLSALGESYLVSREEVVKNYTYLSGKKVSMRGIRKNKSYLLMRLDDTMVKVLYVPKDWEVRLGGKAKASGVYLVGLTDEHGNIDRGSIRSVGGLLFSKQFKILPNDLVQSIVRLAKRSKPKAGITVKKPAHQVKSAPAQPKVNCAMGSELDFGDAEINSGFSKRVPKHSLGADTRDAIRKPAAPAQKREQGEVIAVCKRNNERVGFILLHSGVERVVTVDQLVALCSQNKVSNVTLVNQNNTRFLRGVGIQLSQLDVRNV